MPESTTQSVPYSGGRLLKAMAAISVSVGLATLDTSITNTALPAIAEQLQVGDADVIWVVAAYQIIMTAAIMPLAALGGTIGYRRVFMAGLILFIFSSAFCGLATSLPVLIIARAFQGLGAAAIMSTNTALVKLIYPPERLGKGLGLNALVVALGLAGGPVIASAVLSFASWHWLFLINIPTGVLGLILTLRNIPQSRPRQTGFSMWTAALTFLAFLLFITGLQRAESKAWPEVSAYTTTAILCFAALIRAEQGRSNRVFPTDLFRSADFSLSALTAVLAFAAQGLAMVIFPFFLLYGMGKMQWEIGLLIAPWPVLGALMAPVSGSLSDRFPAAWLSTAGMAVLSVSLLTMTLLTDETPVWLLMFNMACCGVGFGLFLSPNQRTLMASAPPSRSGAASGVLGVTRLLGQSGGAACVAFFLAGGDVQAGQSAIMALWSGAALAMLAAVSSFSRIFFTGQVLKK